MFSIPSVFGRAAPLWVARFVRVHQSHLPSCSCSFNIQALFSLWKSNSLYCLVAASKLQGAIGCHSQLFLPVAADCVMEVLLYHPSPKLPATWHHSQIDLYVVNPLFQNPRHVRSMKAMTFVSAFQIPNCTAVLRFDQPAGFDIIKHGPH